MPGEKRKLPTDSVVSEPDVKETKVSNEDPSQCFDLDILSTNESPQVESLLCILEPSTLKVKKDDESRLEEEIPKLADVELSRLWLNCKIFIGEAILQIIDQCSSTDISENAAKRILTACMMIAKTTVEKITFEDIPESHLSVQVAS